MKLNKYVSICTRTSLFSIHFKSGSVHFGVLPDVDNEVYKIRNGRQEYVQCWWIWGMATEPYDCCLEYFGLGPLMLICALPEVAFWKKI